MKTVGSRFSGIPLNFTPNFSKLIKSIAIPTESLRLKLIASKDLPLNPFGGLLGVLNNIKLFFIVPALVEGALNKVEGHYCGLFKGRKNLTSLLLPKSELIQSKNAHKPVNFRGFFITNPTYSTEFPRILLRLSFGISEIDRYNYRGDRIRTCDLVLPKRRTGLVQH